MDEQTVELREAVEMLRRHKLVIGLCVAVTTLLAVGVSLAQTPVFAASSRMILRPVVPPAAFAISGSRDSGGPLGLELSAESEAQIVGSSLVALRVKAALNLPVDPVILAKSVTVRVLTEELVEITAFSRDRNLAAELANAFGNEYIQYRRQTAAESLGGHADDLRARLDFASGRVAELDTRIVRLSSSMAAISAQESLSPSEAGKAAELKATADRMTAERNELLTQIAGLRQRLEEARRASSTSIGGGEVIEPAFVPRGAASPKPKRNGIVGIMLGLILGVIVAFLREHFDDRIQSVHDASRSCAVPIVAAIPVARTWQRRKTAHLAILASPGSAVAESYRGLRQSLTAMGLGRSIRTVLVTSGGPRAGKTATTANLGVACAQAGMRVVVVSADLRRPRLHEFFGGDNQQGLSLVLNGQSGTLDSLVPTAVAGLWVLPSGPTPRNPSGLLDKGNFGRILDELLGAADVVIIDTPPLSSGADAMVLAPRADLSVIAMRRGSARGSGVAAAVGTLAQAGSSRQVALLNMSDEKASGAYGLDPNAYGPTLTATLKNQSPEATAVRDVEVEPAVLGKDRPAPAPSRNGRARSPKK